MEPSDLFSVFFKNYLSDHPRGTQSKIADGIGLDRKLLNDYIHGRKPLSESKRSLIADFIGVRYEQALAIGRCEKSAPPQKPDLYIKVSDVAKKLEAMNQQDLKLINDMATRLSKN